VLAGADRREARARLGRGAGPRDAARAEEGRAQARRPLSARTPAVRTRPAWALVDGGGGERGAVVGDLAGEARGEDHRAGGGDEVVVVGVPAVRRPERDRL